MDRTEAIISQNFYWTDVKYAVRKEVSNSDTCQRKKWSDKKIGKLPSKLDDEIPWSELCVDLLVTYAIRIMGKKENLPLKSVTMIDPVTGWFEITQYED